MLISEEEFNNGMDFNRIPEEMTEIPDENPATEEKTEPKKSPTVNPFDAYKLGFLGWHGILVSALLAVALAIIFAPVPGGVTVPGIAVHSATADFVKVDSISGAYSISSAYNITIPWEINVNFTNPSEKYGLDYSNLVVVFYFQNNPLWLTVVRGFYQGKKGKEFLNVNFENVPFTVDSGLALSLLKDASVGWSSQFSLHVLGSVGQEKKGKKHKVTSFNAVCAIDVEISQTGGDRVMAAGASSGDCKVSIGEPNEYKECVLFGLFHVAFWLLMNIAADWIFGRV